MAKKRKKKNKFQKIEGIPLNLDMISTAGEVVGIKNIKPLKWHIYDQNNQALHWEDKILEFDTCKDANDFASSAAIHFSQNKEQYENVTIVEDVLEHDGECLNATNLRIGWSLEKEEFVLTNKI